MTEVNCDKESGRRKSFSEVAINFIRLVYFSPLVLIL